MNKIELIDARIKEVESTLVYLLHERVALVKASDALPVEGVCRGHVFADGAVPPEGFCDCGVKK